LAVPRTLCNGTDDCWLERICRSFWLHSDNSIPFHIKVKFLHLMFTSWGILHLVRWLIKLFISFELQLVQFQSADAHSDTGCEDKRGDARPCLEQQSAR
jgi:hypothetical protein